MTQYANKSDPAPRSPGSSGDEEQYIFTTARWDSALIHSDLNTAASCNVPCPIYMLENHYTRLQVAKWGMSAFNADQAQGKLSGPSALLKGFTCAVKQWYKSHPGETPESLRIKLYSYISGRMTTEIVAIPRVPLSTLFPIDAGSCIPRRTRRLDRSCLITNPPSPTEKTMFKTGDRTDYDRARIAANIIAVTSLKEVLLYTPNNHILDGSITTPYFFRGGQWVTPSSDCGGQQGTTRRWALEKGMAVEVYYYD